MAETCDTKFIADDADDDTALTCVRKPGRHLIHRDENGTRFVPYGKGAVIFIDERAAK